MAEYFICPSLATTGNEGTVTNPFRATNIPWSNLEGGDILSFLEVFDGVSSYNEAMYIQQSGEVDNPITFRTATGESNFATFDGDDIRPCIITYGNNHLLIVNLATTQSNNFGINFETSNNIEINDCECYSNSIGMGANNGGGEIHSIKLANNKNYLNANEGIRLNGGVNGYYLYDVLCEFNEVYENETGIRIYASATGALNSKIIVDNNTIRDNTHTATTFGTADNRVGNNSISHNLIYGNGAAPEGENANGLWVGNMSDTIIEHNKCYNNNTGNIDGMGIFLDYQHDIGSYDCTVRYNECYGHTSNFSCVPFSGGDPQANSAGIGICCGAHDNNIYFNLSYGNTVGIYVGGENSTANKIHHNTIWGNRIGIHDRCKTLPGTDYKNNIVFGNTLTGDGETFTRDLYREDSGLVEITEDYNCFPETPSFSNHVIGENSITQDPLLYSNGSLQTDSPCLLTGLEIAGINFVGREGFFGTIYQTPNIGADQTQLNIYNEAKVWKDFIWDK